ncbi:hypothetical protein C6499_01845 [Candidatus Poribacteria bacterium]|nr:MAG: hypothetical protein C6499_01845 [Candidatus Poribacteria bacterium]
MRPAATESPPDFTLVVSGQELGYLEPCGCAEGQIGGFPRRDSMLLQLTSGGKNLLRVANGNLISDARRQSELKAEIGFTALKEMEYAAFNVGPRDLLLGIEQLKYFSNTSGIPFLSANLFQGEEGVFQPFVLHRVHLEDLQEQVAIVGVISQQFEIYAENASADLMLKAPEDVLRELIPQLSSECEFIVLLAHAAIDEAKALAKAFPQIDIIIVGDEQSEALREPISVGDTVLLNPGIKGKALGMLDIRSDKGKKNADSHFQLLTLSERIPDSPRMMDLLLMYQQMLAAENLTADIQQEPLSTGGMYAGNASCKTCHPSEYASWKKTKHSHAYHTLVEKGHENDPDCLTCHTVGFGFQTGFISEPQTPTLADVGCENCHGVGGNHVKNPKPGYGKVTKANCLTCHTSENSPNFDYDAYFPKILHEVMRTVATE